jgi:L-ribulose-5-phosphate 4-epimerase
MNVYEAYKKICESGLVIGSWGNVSVKDKDLFTITPSGVSIDDLTIEKLVTFRTLDETTSEYKPSVDTNIHLEIYEGFGGVKSVIHTHSEYATIFSQAKLPIPCVGTTHSDYFYGEIPIVDDLTKNQIDNDFEKNSGKSIVDFFKQNKINPLYMKAALLPSHGPVVWGESIEDAVDNAIVLEHIAKLAYRTCILSEVNMDNNLIDKHFFRKHGENSYYGQ